MTASRFRRPRTPALTAAVGLLGVLADSESGLSLGALYRHARLNWSTCVTTLRQLERLRLVARDDSRGYRLGAALIQFGLAAARHGGLLDLARPVLWRLHADTRLTAFAARPEGDRIVVLDCVAPSAEVHVRVPVGVPFHATTGALGKGWLAFLPEAEARAILAREGVQRFTERSHRTVDAYVRALRRVRRRGYAESFEEFSPGVHAVTAPVLWPDGRVALVLGLAGFKSVFTRDRVRTAGARLRAEADRISAAIRVPGDGGPRSIADGNSPRPPARAPRRPESANATSPPGQGA